MSNIKEDIAVFWFRRDLRLNDNKGLFHALNSGKKVLPLFIFDADILNELSKDDARVTFIHELLTNINNTLTDNQSSLLVKHGKPIEVLKNLIKEYAINSVYCNEDYEPYGIKRDEEIANLLSENNINFNTFQDHIIMHPKDVLKDDGTPFKVYTPYSKKWKSILTSEHLKHYPSEDFKANFYPHQSSLLSLNDLGFIQSTIRVLPYKISSLTNYKELRD